MVSEQTASMEDYLEAIAFVGGEERKARVGDISKQLGVRMSSVNSALKKLAGEGLVEHERYGQVNLTPEGVKIAQDVVVRHEMLKTFLSEILGIDPEIAEDDGCKIEHSLSPQTRDRLSKFIEFVLASPGGKPEWLKHFVYFVKHGERPDECTRRARGILPPQENRKREIGSDSDVSGNVSRRRHMATVARMRLSEMKPREKGTIVRVGGGGAVRRRLLDMGVIAESEVEVERVAPLGDPIAIKIKGYSLSLRKEEAANVEVEMNNQEKRRCL